MRTLGLEIGRGVIRAVVGDSRKGRLQLLEAATIPVSGESDQALAGALGGFLAEHGRGGARVVIGLPQRHSIVKLVRLPATSEDNLRRMARASADTAIPLPIEQVRFDAAVVDPGDATNDATVTIAACRRDVIESLLAALATVGLDPAILDVSPLALANAFAATVRDSGQATGILELGDDDVQLVILDAKGRLRQVRSIVAEPSEIADEVRRSCQSYAGAAGEPVARLLLVGPGATDGVAVLNELLPLPVQLGDPWSGCGAEGGFADQGATYAVATGLVHRGGDAPLKINLRTEPRPEAPARHGNLLGVVAGLVFALLLGVGVMCGEAWRNRQAEARNWSEQVVEAERLVKSFGGEDPDLVDTLSQTAKVVRQDSNWLDFLRDLSAGLPGGLSLDELTCDRARPVVLRGRAMTNAAIAQAMDVLNGLGRFSAVRLDYSNAEKIGKELVYSFQITCPWKEAPKDPAAGKDSKASRATRDRATTGKAADEEKDLK